MTTFHLERTGSTGEAGRAVDARLGLGKTFNPKHYQKLKLKRKKYITTETSQGVDGRRGVTMELLGTTITTEASESLSSGASSGAGKGRQTLAVLRAARWATLLAIGSIMRPSIPDLFSFGFFKGPAVERGGKREVMDLPKNKKLNNKI